MNFLLDSAAASLVQSSSSNEQVWPGEGTTGGMHLSHVKVDCADAAGKGEDATTALRRARFLRVRITESASGSVRLETRLPSQFVDGMAMVIPQVCWRVLLWEGISVRAVLPYARSSGAAKVAKGNASFHLRPMPITQRTCIIG